MLSTTTSLTCLSAPKRGNSKGRRERYNLGVLGTEFAEKMAEGDELRVGVHAEEMDARENVIRLERSSSHHLL